MYLYIRKRNNLNDIVVYNQQKRQHCNIIQPYTQTQNLDIYIYMKWLNRLMSRR